MKDIIKKILNEGRFGGQFKIKGVRDISEFKTTKEYLSYLIDNTTPIKFNIWKYYTGYIDPNNTLIFYYYRHDNPDPRFSRPYYGSAKIFSFNGDILKATAEHFGRNEKGLQQMFSRLIRERFSDVHKAGVSRTNKITWYRKQEEINKGEIYPAEEY